MPSILPPVKCYCMALLFYIFLLSFVAFQIASVGRGTIPFLGSCSDTAGVADFDGNRFSGTWYEIARTPNPYQGTDGRSSTLNQKMIRRPRQPVPNDIIKVLYGVRPEDTTTFRYSRLLPPANSNWMHWLDPCELHLPFLSSQRNGAATWRDGLNVPICDGDSGIVQLHGHAEQDQMEEKRGVKSEHDEFWEDANNQRGVQGGGAAAADGGWDRSSSSRGSTTSATSTSAASAARFRGASLLGDSPEGMPDPMLRLRVTTANRSTSFWREHEAMVNCEIKNVKNDSNPSADGMKDAARADNQSASAFEVPELSGWCELRWSWFPVLFSHKVAETDYTSYAILHSCFSFAGLFKYEYGWALRRRLPSELKTREDLFSGPDGEQLREVVERLRYATRGSFRSGAPDIILAPVEEMAVVDIENRRTRTGTGGSGTAPAASARGTRPRHGLTGAEQVHQDDRALGMASAQSENKNSVQQHLLQIQRSDLEHQSGPAERYSSDAPLDDTTELSAAHVVYRCARFFSNESMCSEFPCILLQF